LAQGIEGRRAVFSAASLASQAVHFVNVLQLAAE
jgi:hypothetical protein